ncbi:hypothetical protein GPECTOR_82g230 [Gonium pectorale]|uniref:Uncharacterized protein n=1 Tax=Gonium pectorale TaxID=33097 RepID=A0A150G1E7_GONPE|nr:hypothetical protein GPECTOR_82g230 [Gonium pectorale]|eukprot:KXZ43696.1 hypothetical protein GPECTOR_82g230 [Gonium pectorale]
MQTTKFSPCSARAICPPSARQCTVLRPCRTAFALSSGGGPRIPPRGPRAAGAGGPGPDPDKGKRQQPERQPMTDAEARSIFVAVTNFAGRIGSSLILLYGLYMVASSISGHQEAVTRVGKLAKALSAESIGQFGK